MGCRLFLFLRIRTEYLKSLMATVGELCADLHGRGLWDANDAELLEAVWQFRRNFEAAMVSSVSG